MSLPPDADIRHGAQTDMAGLKKTTRKKLLDIRKNMPADERSRLDAEIGRRVLSYLKARRFASIGVYLPIRNEPELFGLYEELAKTMELSLPVVADRDSPLVFVAWKPGDALATGDFNVSVPAKQVPVAMPQALLIPCVGYTQKGYRLGYGGGFFDRTLERYPQTHTIGVAYSRLQSEFEPEENDIPLSVVITEDGIVF